MKYVGDGANRYRGRAIRHPKDPRGKEHGVSSCAHTVSEVYLFDPITALDLYPLDGPFTIHIIENAYKHQSPLKRNLFKIPKERYGSSAYVDHSTTEVYVLNQETSMVSRQALDTLPATGVLYEEEKPQSPTGYFPSNILEDIPDSASHLDHITTSDTYVLHNQDNLTVDPTYCETKYEPTTNFESSSIAPPYEAYSYTSGLPSTEPYTAAYGYETVYGADQTVGFIPYKEESTEYYIYKRHHRNK